MSARSQGSGTEVLILGGGPAGAALGILLARAGRAVEILEKSAGAHDKVCGEFLSREAVMYLDQLGLDLGGLGAVPIQRVLLAARSIIAETELPFRAMSVTRRVLDEALLAQAAAVGAQVIRGCRVESLTASGPGWEAVLSGRERRWGRTAFLATGKHDLNGRPRPQGKQNDLVAFKMYFRLMPGQQAALAGAVELILFPGGYAGLQPVEGGMANLCLVATRTRLRSCSGRWSSLFEHLRASSNHLRQRLEGAEPLLDRPLALSSIPYGFVRARSEDGVWHLGDQAAVIPSFSGDGMSIALHSARVAASHYLKGGSPASFQRQIRADLKRSVGVATLLSRMMVAAPTLAQVARFLPSVMREIATGTRVPPGVLLGPDPGSGPAAGVDGGACGGTARPRG